MKNSIILAVIMILGVACKGPEGGKGMDMETCDIAKNEVREILTGKSGNCGLVKSAITVGEATQRLENRWSNDHTIVAIRNGAFYTISMFDGKVIAFRGQLELSEHEDENKVHAVTTIFDGLVVEGDIEFSDDKMITITESGQSEYTATTPDAALNIEDADITIVRTQEDLDKFNNM